MAQMNLSVKQKQTHRHRERTGDCQGGGGWVREGRGVWVNRRKLVYVEWIENKILL